MQLGRLSIVLDSRVGVCTLCSLPEPYVWTEKQLFSLKMCKNTIVGVDPTHIIFLDYNTRSMYGVSECTGLQSLETKVSMPKIHMPKIHMPKIPSFVTEWSAGKSIRGVEAKLDCQEVSDCSFQITGLLFSINTIYCYVIDTLF